MLKSKKPDLNQFSRAFWKSRFIYRPSIQWYRNSCLRDIDLPLIFHRETDTVPRNLDSSPFNLSAIFPKKSTFQSDCPRLTTAARGMRISRFINRNAAVRGFSSSIRYLWCSRYIPGLPQRFQTDSLQRPVLPNRLFIS